MSYQKLFDFFAREHNLILTEGQMQDIIDVADNGQAQTIVQLKSALSDIGNLLPINTNILLSRKIESIVN